MLEKAYEPTVTTNFNTVSNNQRGASPETPAVVINAGLDTLDSRFDRFGGTQDIRERGLSTSQINVREKGNVSPSANYSSTR